eukprot:14722802-Alexandrium_andersonii.AAC.1
MALPATRATSRSRKDPWRSKACQGQARGNPSTSTAGTPCISSNSQGSAKRPCKDEAMSALV